MILSSFSTTLFLPNFLNKTTSVAMNPPKNKPYYLIVKIRFVNKVIRSVYVMFFATEVVQFEKLDKNKVCEK
jgi:hypothetical protein